MPKHKKWLEWTPQALDELSKGLAYYAEQNPTVALRMQADINQAALSLIATIVPAHGKLGRVAQTRELILGAKTPFVLVFRESAAEITTIQILHVMHTSRKYP